MSASIYVGQAGCSTGSRSGSNTPQTCYFPSRGQPAWSAARPYGQLHCSGRRAQHHAQCAAEVGKDRFLDTEPAAGQPQAGDAYAAASTASASDSEPISVWDSKPPWCQPWTILLTGAAIDAIAWKASGGSLLVTGLVGFPIALWWWLFLGVMPAQYAEYQEQVIEAEARREWQ